LAKSFWLIISRIQNGGHILMKTFPNSLEPGNWQENYFVLIFVLIVLIFCCMFSTHCSSCWTIWDWKYERGTNPGFIALWL